jgi:hypothetical protein
MKEDSTHSKLDGWDPASDKQLNYLDYPKFEEKVVSR